jgi:2-polyprenyl-3-methyl-5-hydroxy-6-metoxy-1,4-benzoquinol methylase
VCIPLASVKVRNVEEIKVSVTNSKIDKFWSNYEPVKDGTGFYMSPITRPYMIDTAYGKDLVDGYANNPNYAEDIFMKKYLNGAKIKTVLSICCGFGSVERHFVSRLDGVEECRGIDLAVGALDVARQKAAAAGLKNISYETADLNNYVWEKEKYDLVIANGALHHLKNLEQVLDGIKTSLTPNGILYACEYVGPSYQDHSVRQLEIINSAAFLLPPELRARRGLPYFNERVFRLLEKLHAASVKEVNPKWPLHKRLVARVIKGLFGRRQNKFNFGTVFISPKKYFLRNDPSEGVRSAEIIPLIKKRFSDVEIRPFGGGILQHALDWKFYASFDKNNPLHAKSFDMLCQLEKHYMNTGEISIENAFIIARK